MPPRLTPPASAAAEPVVSAQATPAPAAPSIAAAQRYTAWSFGELPELLEIRRGAQSLVGFPALIDKTTHVEIEVFDEPELAATRHRAGLRRLIALQLKEPIKYLEKNIPDLTRKSSRRSFRANEITLCISSLSPSGCAPSGAGTPAPAWRAPCETSERFPLPPAD